MTDTAKISPHDAMADRDAERRIPDEVTDLPETVGETYRVALTGLVLPMSVGIYEFEKARHQRVRISITLDLSYPEGGFADDYMKVYNYERLVEGVKLLAAEGHVLLVETVAERIADMALSDRRAFRCAVTVEKLDIFQDAQAAGTTIEKRRV